MCKTILAENMHKMLEIFVQQCRFRANVFSGNEFPRIRDIRQNVSRPNLGNLCATVPISGKRVFWE